MIQFQVLKMFQSCSLTEIIEKYYKVINLSRKFLNPDHRVVFLNCISLHRIAL